MILRTKEDTPVEVLRAYQMLNKVHGASKQCLRTIFVRECQKTMNQIKKHCFKFVQNVLTNDSMWILSTRQCIGGKFLQCNGGYVSTSIAPPSLESSARYNTQWRSLTKKGNAPLKEIRQNDGKISQLRVQFRFSHIV